MIKKILITGFISAVAFFGFFAFKFLGPAVNNKEDIYFYIKNGDDYKTVKDNLVNKQFIKSTSYDMVSKLLKFKKPKPGRYKLKDGLSLWKLVRLLRSGEQVPVKMVIIKERTKEAFAGKIGFGKKFDFECDSLQMINFLNSNELLKKYGVDTNTVMAMLLPYTYSLNWNSTPEKIFQQFHTAYQKFWTKERKGKADSLQLTQLKVSILASIVEEETNKKEDRFNIASTYLNRLRTGMPLQADPTIKFALKDFTLKRILLTHLKYNSPYNTYINTGLPPGPICTPSPETINAVLYAPQTDYLYFVASSKFDGSSVFTTNFNDHLKYAQLYQQELTRRMDSVKKANQLKN